MFYSTNKNTILGVDSREHSLLTPLIRAPGRPLGGWRVTLPVRGQRIQVEGNTAIQVYNGARVLLTRNGVQVTPVDLWTTLNADWLSRTPEKYQIVRHSDLMSIVTVANGSATAVNPRKRSYKPADWGASAWGWLNLFLAREHYHFRDFLLQCNFVLDCLNESTNPGLGCSECYMEWLKHLEELKRHPEWDQEAARRWLFSVHNLVNARLNKRILSYEVAAKKAFWT